MSDPVAQKGRGGHRHVTRQRKEGQPWGQGTAGSQASTGPRGDSKRPGGTQEATEGVDGERSHPSAHSHRCPAVLGIDEAPPQPPTPGWWQADPRCPVVPPIRL